MPSEHRLHPASIFFNLGKLAKDMLIPAVVVLFTAGRSDTWQTIGLILFVPYVLAAIVRYVSFRYRYDEHELVLRSGVFMRNERHIPYTRIQNLDAIQNVLHRMFGVVTVRLDTGAGKEPEGTFSVLPLAALEEMRRRVFVGRAATMEGQADATAPAVTEPGRVTLLTIPPRRLLVAGLIENRGMVLIAAALGVVYELGLMDGLFDRLFGDRTAGRGAIRRLAAAIFGRGTIPWTQVAIIGAIFIGALAAIRVLSMVWALVRLYGFTLTRAGEDLRAEYGLLTRVVATIPMRRIQTVTIFEGPWHQIGRLAAVRVRTASGQHESSGSEREWIAPILPREATRALLQTLLPEVAVDDVVWQPVHPRGVVRATRLAVFFAVVAAALFVRLLGWWDLLLMAVLIAWAAIAARQHVRRLSWAIAGDAVIVRGGWIWRHTSVARFTRIQGVRLAESPFDRRHRMASIHVDTAGAGSGGELGIPYLGRDVADGLFQRLSAAAAHTEFKW
jgi:putative membrane protein